MNDDKLQKIYSDVIKICIELNVISKEFLVSIGKNGGNNDCTMAFFFLIRQIELLDSVIRLSGHRDFNAMSILVRAMLENMAHLYYSNMNNTYADKWAAYQYIDMLRTYEQKIANDFEVKSEHIEYLLGKLEEHCMQFIRKEFIKDVKQNLRNRKLPKGDWFYSSWGGSKTSIINKVSNHIDRVNRQAVGEHYTKECLRFIYHELSLKAHVMPQGFAYEFTVESNTIRFKDDWIIEDIKVLLPAIEYLARTADIANTRFHGNFRAKLQEIGIKTECLSNIFVDNLKEHDYK